MSCGQRAAEAVRRPSEQAARGIIAAAQKNTGSLQGTATACVAQLGPQSTLHVANVGDSGVVVFRRGECIFASEVVASGFFVARKEYFLCSSAVTQAHAYNNAALK